MTPCGSSRAANQHGWYRRDQRASVARRASWLRCRRRCGCGSGSCIAGWIRRTRYRTAPSTGRRGSAARGNHHLRNAFYMLALVGEQRDRHMKAFYELLQGQIPNAHRRRTKAAARHLRHLPQPHTWSRGTMCRSLEVTLSRSQTASITERISMCRMQAYSLDPPKHVGRL
jgi:hypothetical protein